MKPLARGLVRVHIGTTEGPAEIQRLTQEAPEIRSVVCLDGRAVALPISRDYESFVRRPTGLIERLWGGPSFRLDVGARITDGLSWQLGAFLAHGLKAAGRLAERGPETLAPRSAAIGAAAPGAVAMVWATGEIDAALAVRPVEHIARKLELSAALLREQAALRPLVLVPAAAADLARATLAGQGLADACRVLGVADAAEALACVGLTLPGAHSARGARRIRIAAAIAALLLLPAGAATGWKLWAGDWPAHPPAEAAHPPPPATRLADASPPEPQRPVKPAPAPDDPVPHATLPNTPVANEPVANEPVSNAPASDAPASDAPKPEAPRPDAPITTAPIPTAVVTAAPAQKIDREWQQQAESGDLIGLDERLTRMAQSPDCGGCGEQIGRFRAWLTAHAPSAAPVVSVQATPRSPGCRGAETPPPLAFGADAGDTIPTSSNVCQVRYIVSGAAHVALVLSAPELQRGIDQRAEGAGHAALALDIPVVACCLNDQRIVALASPWPLDRVLDWLAPQIADFWQPLPDPLVARLAALGVTVRVLRHQIDLRPPR